MILFRPASPARMDSAHQWQTPPDYAVLIKIRKIEDILRTRPA